MVTRYSRPPYLLAILLGVAALFIPAPQSFPIAHVLSYLAVGSVFGFVWPRPSWRWGLWVGGPVVLLLLSSVLFAGQLDIFLQKDMPILLAALLAPCAGGLLGAYLRGRRQQGAGEAGG